MTPISTRDSSRDRDEGYEPHQFHRSRSPPREGHRSRDAPGGSLTRRGRVQGKQVPLRSSPESRTPSPWVIQVTREKEEELLIERQSWQSEPSHLEGQNHPKESYKIEDPAKRIAPE